MSIAGRLGLHTWSMPTQLRHSDWFHTVSVLPWPESAWWLHPLDASQWSMEALRKCLACGTGLLPDEPQRWQQGQLFTDSVKGSLFDGRTRDSIRVKGANRYGLPLSCSFDRSSVFLAFIVIFDTYFIYLFITDPIKNDLLIRVRCQSSIKVNWFSCLLFCFLYTTFVFVLHC